MLNTKRNNFNITDKYSEVIDYTTQFCQSLHDYLGVRNFGKLLVYPDKTYSYFGNDKGLVSDYTTTVDSTILFCQNIEPEYHCKNYYHYISWPHKVTHHSMNLYFKRNFWNGYSIARENDGCLHLYWFATSPDNTSFQDLCAKNKALLTQIITCYDNNISNFDFSNKANRFSFSGEVDFSLPKSCANNSEIYNIKEFTEALAQNASSVYYNGRNIKFTLKEIECLRLLSKGYIAKQIAGKMNISPKTVEKHFENIKVKIGCSLRSEMVYIFQELVCRNQFF